MSVAKSDFKGIVRGRVIELEETTGLMDGQAVTVTVRPAEVRGDGLRRAFGAWANDASELDQFVEQVRQDRKRDRREPAA